MFLYQRMDQLPNTELVDRLLENQFVNKTEFEKEGVPFTSFDLDDVGTNELVQFATSICVESLKLPENPFFVSDLDFSDEELPRKPWELGHPPIKLTLSELLLWKMDMGMFLLAALNDQVEERANGYL